MCAFWLFIRRAGRRFGRSPKPQRYAAQAAVCPPHPRNAFPLIREPRFGAFGFADGLRGPSPHAPLRLARTSSAFPAAGHSETAGARPRFAPFGRKTASCAANLFAGAHKLRARPEGEPSNLRQGVDYIDNVRVLREVAEHLCFAL